MRLRSAWAMTSSRHFAPAIGSEEAEVREVFFTPDAPQISCAYLGVRLLDHGFLQLRLNRAVDLSR